MLITHEPKNMDDFHRCCTDKMWRMNNLYWIKDKRGDKVKFRPNRAQRRLMENRHGRDIGLKARQLGFTTWYQIHELDECLFNNNTNAGVIAHNEKDCQAFFKDKIKYAYDALHPYLKEKLRASNDSANELRFDNGSVIRVGTSLRSGTYQLLHISEYGKLCAQRPDRALEVKTGALPTVPIGGEIFIESTAEGRIGDFFRMCEIARKHTGELTPLDFKFHFFPWHEDPENTLDATPLLTNHYLEYFKNLEKRGIVLTNGQKSWYIKTEGFLGEEMKRENPSYPEEAFEAAVEGAYFSKQMAQVRSKGQILHVPLEAHLPVHTFWDLGRDTTAIWFFQKVGFDYRFIDYFQNSGEDMAYYVSALQGKPYNYGDMYLPHDGTRQSLASKTSPADVLYENRFQVRIVNRTPNKDNSIEKARQVLPKCFFDTALCKEGIVCLDSYRKEKDEKLGTWKKQPLHNAASHGADAFMTFADGFFHEEEIENDPDPVVGRNKVTGY